MAVFYSLPCSPPMVSNEFVTVRGKFDSGNCFLIATGPSGFVDWLSRLLRQMQNARIAIAHEQMQVEVGYSWI